MCVCEHVCNFVWAMVNMNMEKCCSETTSVCSDAGV